MRKLNLASGTDLRDPPWENWDVTRWPGTRGPDKIWDARSDRIDCPDASVDEIVAGYLLLHVAYPHHVPLVAEMFRVLKPGGRLEIGEVDMPVAMRRWMMNPHDQSARDMLWGEQSGELAEFDTHRAGHSEASLREMLIKAGFVRLKRFKQHAATVWYELSVEAFKP